MPGFEAKSMNKSGPGNSTGIMGCGGFEYVKKPFHGRMQDRSFAAVTLYGQ